jgi:hypothetical protein
LVVQWLSRQIRGEGQMSVDLGSPSKARFTDGREQGITKRSAAGVGRASLVLLCLIEVAWICALVYGAFQAADFVL